VRGLPVPLLRACPTRHRGVRRQAGPLRALRPLDLHPFIAVLRRRRRAQSVSAVGDVGPSNSSPSRVAGPSAIRVQRFRIDGLKLVRRSGKCDSPTLRQHECCCETEEETLGSVLRRSREEALVSGPDQPPGPILAPTDVVAEVVQEVGDVHQALNARRKLPDPTGQLSHAASLYGRQRGVATSPASSSCRPAMTLPACVRACERRARPSESCINRPGLGDVEPSTTPPIAGSRRHKEYARRGTTAQRPVPRARSTPALLEARCGTAMRRARRPGRRKSSPARLRSRSRPAPRGTRRRPAPDRPRAKAGRR
jgi:hypothetical protein